MTTTPRRRTPPSADSESSNGATTGYEAKLWQMADALRGSMDAAEYKHVVLGLIFLKYISDAFQELHAWLESKTAEGYNPEDMDEYRGREHLLGAAGGPLAPPQGTGAAADHWPAGGRRHDRHRTGQPRRSRTCCPRTTPGPPWTRPASASSSTLSPTSRLETLKPAPKTCWAGCTSTSSPSSPAPRARRAASSTPRVASLSSWWRCWSPTRAVSTTPAAAHPACSCSR